MASEKSIVNLLQQRAKDTKTKIKVAYVLGKLKNKIPGNVLGKVVEKLLKFSSDENAKVRYASVFALKSLYEGFSANEREKINERLYDLCTDKNKGVLLNVKEFIKKLNFESRIAEKILILSKSPYPRRRSKAIAIFKNTRTIIPHGLIDEVTKSISKLCGDERLVVRMAAVKEIKYDSGVLVNTQEKLTNVLLNACSDRSWIVRYNAVKAICSQRDNFHGEILNKIFEILLNLCSYEKWEVRFSAVNSIARMKYVIPYGVRNKIILKISQVSKKDTNRIVKESAKTALERLQKI